QGMAERGQQLCGAVDFAFRQGGSEQPVEQRFDRQRAARQHGLETDCVVRVHWRERCRQNTARSSGAKRCACAEPSVFDDDELRDTHLPPDHIEIEPEVRPRAKRTRKRGNALIWLRRLVLFALVIGLLPALLAFAYLPRAVHPLSTLMMKDLVTFSGYDRRWMPLEDISPRLVHSMMMSE